MEMNGSSIPVLSVSPTRVVVQCPDVAAGTKLDVVLISQSQSSNHMTIDSDDVAPGIFTTAGDGGGAGLILLRDTSEVAGDRDASAPRHGDIVSIVATGLGHTMGSGPNRLTAFVSVLVDGITGRDRISAQYRIGRLPDGGTRFLSMRLTAMPHRYTCKPCRREGL